MHYLITFLEGLITFISPCILPLLPVYVLYFAGDDSQAKRYKPLINALGFVTGFTVLFILLGVFASVLGGLLVTYKTAVNLITGAVVVVFGFHYTGIIKIAFLNKTTKPYSSVKPNNFFSSVMFGVVFAVGWTPCTGPFLGSAMMMASQQTEWTYGMILLICYSIGLGIPFVLSAVLIDKLKGAFQVIKQHYRMINTICGLFLIVIGILMMSGIFSQLTSGLT